MNKTMNEKKLMGDSSCSTLCEVYCTDLFGDIPVHEKGDTVLSAFCIADNQEPENGIKISSNDKKLKWWKLDYLDIDRFIYTKDAEVALKWIETSKTVFAYEIWYECDFTLQESNIYRPDKTFYAGLETECPFAGGDKALAIMNLYGSWYVIPVKVVGPVTKKALRRIWDEGILKADFYDSFETYYDEYMQIFGRYESDFIVLPLINIETNFGKETCDLIAVCRLFPMQWMEQLIHKEK